MTRPFLTARWQNLFLASYAVPPSLLEKRLPPGLALDLKDGSAFVSLVAFEFLDTRVLGVGWPGYRNFGELNLLGLANPLATMVPKYLQYGGVAGWTNAQTIAWGTTIYDPQGQTIAWGTSADGDTIAWGTGMPSLDAQ